MVTRVQTLLNTFSFAQNKPYTPKDYRSKEEPRWCPGCGNYSILTQVQKVLADLSVPPYRLAFVSGIGCSSRFPYYINTYGFHGIHGRAIAIASGLKIARPDITVWVITGDGDGLSIGGNHFIHALRRNIDINILLFNNQIYALTKGQYSPTSEHGAITKSSPDGVIDYPFNPVALAIGANSTFVARTIDRDPRHLQNMLKRAAMHKGTSFIEIYQNCNVFNDGVFDRFSNKEIRDDYALFLEHGKPLIFGKNRNKAIRLNGYIPEIISLDDGKHSTSDAVIYNEQDTTLAFLIATLSNHPNMPRPFGVFLDITRTTYETELLEQIESAITKNGKGDVNELFNSGDTWIIQ
ncbi:MAG: 2-oxoacid:ferredoxin oxidoreductase subunit beta [Bacteroidetes bacterium]|nr:2-oxoacid:ferredoxin oxidoreductase subunit beta [Bacteroidota bacterium]